MIIARDFDLRSGYEKIFYPEKVDYGSGDERSMMNPQMVGIKAWTLTASTLYLLAWQSPTWWLTLAQQAQQPFFPAKAPSFLGDIEGGQFVLLFSVERTNGC